MGIRVHLFRIRNQKDWIQLQQLLETHNAPHKGTDKEIEFCCFLQHDDDIFAKYIAYTSNQESVDFLSSKLEDRYFPPWEKPFWYNDVSVSKMKKLTFPSTKAPLTVSEFLAKEEIEFPLDDDEFEWNIPSEPKVNDQFADRVFIPLDSITVELPGSQKLLTLKGPLTFREFARAVNEAETYENELLAPVSISRGRGGVYYFVCG